MKYTFTCYRELTNSDTAKDFQFKLGEKLQLIWAENESTSNIKDYHGDSYDQADSIILEDQGPGKGGGRSGKVVKRKGRKRGDRDEKIKGWLNHGIGMGVVWVFLAWIMFATNRWYQQYWKYA